jgi:hypothetical protein
MIVIDNAEQGWHGLKLVVRRSSVKQFDYGASETPDVRSSSSTRQFDDLGSHPVRCTDYATLM